MSIAFFGDDVAKAPAREVVLAARDRHVERPRHLDIALMVLRADRLLEPQDVELLQHAAELDGVGHRGSSGWRRPRACTSGPIAWRTAVTRLASSFRSPRPIFILMARKPSFLNPSASSTASSTSRSMSMK